MCVEKKSHIFIIKIEATYIKTDVIYCGLKMFKTEIIQNI